MPRPPKPFRIFGISLVKNEADIIRHSLRAALEWCDYIFVYDNGSDDGTWQKVRRLACREPRIVPYKRAAVPFHDSLRAEVRAAFSCLASPGDWWCNLDADEFYIDNPRDFLARVPRRFDIVWSASFQYYFTEKDAARYKCDPAAFARTPVQERLRYYVNNWSEPRFLRHRPRSSRTITLRSFPGRIRLKHFQYRSPEQIEKRLATRGPAIAAGIFLHEGRPDWSPRRHTSVVSKEIHTPRSWRERIADSRNLIFDPGDGPYVIDEPGLPLIHDFRFDSRKL